MGTQHLILTGECVRDDRRKQLLVLDHQYARRSARAHGARHAALAVLVPLLTPEGGRGTSDEGAYQHRESGEYRSVSRRFACSVNQRPPTMLNVVTVAPEPDHGEREARPKPRPRSENQRYSGGRKCAADHRRPGNAGCDAFKGTCHVPGIELSRG